jgi:large subunit ribosomal protein L17e
MVKKYSREPPVLAKSCRARGDDLRVHYKNTFEVAACIRGRKLRDAQQYLQDVLDHKRVIPYRRHNDGVPRKAQCN